MPSALYNNELQRLFPKNQKPKPNQNNNNKPQNEQTKRYNSSILQRDICYWNYKIIEISLKTCSKHLIAFNAEDSKNMKWMAYGNYLWLNWQLNGDILIDLEI